MDRRLTVNWKAILQWSFIFGSVETKKNKIKKKKKVNPNRDLRRPVRPNFGAKFRVVVPRRFTVICCWYLAHFLLANIGRYAKSICKCLSFLCHVQITCLLLALYFGQYSVMEENMIFWPKAPKASPRLPNRVSPIAQHRPQSKFNYCMSAIGCLGGLDWNWTEKKTVADKARNIFKCNRRKLSRPVQTIMKYEMKY